MKKLTIAILLLLLASPCLAEEPITLARMSTAIVGGGMTAAAACTPDSGDLYNQGFEAGTTPGNWCTTTGCSGTPNYGASPPTLTGCASCCLKSLQINTTTAAEKTYYNHGSALTDVYFRFYLYFPLASVNQKNIFEASYDQWSRLKCYLRVYSDGVSEITVRIVGTGGDTGWSNITPDAWNLVEGHIIRNSTTTLKVNGTANGTTGTAGDFDFQFFIFGTEDSITLDYYIDEFAISTTGWIGAP
jgi:hypothetical protein